MTARTCALCVAILLTSPHITNAAELDYFAATWEMEAASNLRTGKLDYYQGGLTIRLEEQLTDRVHATLEATAATRRSNPRDQRLAWTRKYSEHKSEFETLTLSYAADDFDAIVGSQVVNVGRADAFQLLDRFNGRDLCDFSRLDLDFKEPNQLAQVRVFQGDLTIRLIAAPFSAENDIADDRSSCADAFTNSGRFDFVRDPPNDSLDAWAAGAEISLHHDEYDFSLNVMSMREGDFVLRTYPDFEKVRPRVLWLGGSGSINVGDEGVLRAEVALSPERSFTLDPAETALRAGSGISVDGTDERWNTLGLLGYEFEFGDWTADIQLFADLVDNGPELIRSDLESFSSVRIRKSFMNDRLTIELLSVHDFGNRDIAVRFDLSYEVSDQFTFTTGLVHYDDLGGRPGFFGAFEGRPQVFAGVQLQY